MVRKAVILAAAPVALLPVANRPLVAHTLRGLARAGIRRAALVAEGSVRDALEGSLHGDQPENCSVEWAEHEPESGLVGTLAGLEEFVGAEPFVLHLGDSLARKGLRSVLRTAPAPLDTTVLMQEFARGDHVVELAPRRVVDIASRNGHSDGLPAGAWLLGGGVLEAAAGVPASSSWELEITTMTRCLAEQGGQVTLRQVDEWWRYRQRPEALLEGNRFALEGLKGSPVEAQLSDTRIQGAVSIHPTARLESSIVRGPAVIGAGARLRDAYVGPYTSIGDEVVIEGAEIEHSIILPGASISHLGGRLEASVVGPKARVFRDFRLPKALRLNVGEGAEVSLA